MDSTKSWKVVDYCKTKLFSKYFTGWCYVQKISFRIRNKFYRRINSAIILQNASTQFADGGEFGFGGEIGISTDKLHARGPVGLEGLTSQKFVIKGQGQLRT